jgi:hypothetical protein
MGVSTAVSERFAKSLHVDKYVDPMARNVVYNIRGWFASNRIFEDEYVVTQPLSWRERIAVLFGKQVPVKVRIEMRRNCPHLPSVSDSQHLRWIVPSRDDNRV